MQLPVSGYCLDGEPVFSITSRLKVEFPGLRADCLGSLPLLATIPGNVQPDFLRPQPGNFLRIVLVRDPKAGAARVNRLGQVSGGKR